LISLLACGRIGFDVADRGIIDAPGDLQFDVAAGSNRILFIRAGAGTVGYLNGGGDDNTCDINDAQNQRGWATLRETLIAGGFLVEQRQEGPLASPAPADLSNLDAYAIVVFGSNNFVYSAADADAVETYVRKGGAALFISDAGFGRTGYAESPASDQPFMSRFDLVMTEDANDIVSLDPPRFPDPAHPVLTGVTRIQADGTSAIRIVDLVGDVAPTLLVHKMPDDVRIAGALQPATASDAAVVVAQVGLGRVAGLCDRDVIANLNPSSGIGMASNRVLALNLFEWLADLR
jgi:hypothetical protein